MTRQISQPKAAVGILTLSQLHLHTELKVLSQARLVMLYLVYMHLYLLFVVTSACAAQQLDTAGTNPRNS